MPSDLIQFIFRHLTGSRATEVDVVPLGAHRELILGRAPSAAVRFDPRRDAGVGRHHARIEPGDEAGQFQIVDLGSRNGTFLNGERIERAMPLHPGDVVQLGEDGPRLEVLLELLAAPRPDATVAATAPPHGPRGRLISEG